MSSWNGFNIFERSTREPRYCNPEFESSEGRVPSSPTVRNPGSRSPAISKNPPESDPSAQLLGCPFPEYSAVGVSMPANGQSLDPKEQMVEESHATGCYDRYKNAIMCFRNSKFINILHFLFFLVPISAIIMGLLFVHECPKASYLPGLVTAVGIIGALFMCIWTAFGCRGTPCSNLRKSALAVLFGLLFIGTAIETCLFVKLSPCYDPLARDYCSKTFVSFLIYKEMAALVALLLAVAVYAPGSGLFRDCPVPLPASAFFNFR